MKAKIYILQNRRGKNLFRWLWLSTNLFVTVKFHDVETELSRLSGGGICNLLAGEYLLFRPLHFLPRQFAAGKGRDTTMLRFIGGHK